MFIGKQLIERKIFYTLMRLFDLFMRTNMSKHRQSDRWIVRQRGRQTVGQSDREVDTVRKTGRQTDKQRLTDRQTHRQIGRQADSRTNRQTDRQVESQTERQTDRQVEYQCVLAGVVDHPPLLHHVTALPLCVFDGLNDSHQRDVVTGGRAAGGRTEHNLSPVCLHTCVLVCDAYLMARLDSSRSGSCRSQRSLGPASSRRAPSDIRASSMSSNGLLPRSTSWSSRQPSTMITSDSAPGLRSSVR